MKGDVGIGDGEIRIEPICDVCGKKIDGDYCWLSVRLKYYIEKKLKSIGDGGVTQERCCIKGKDSPKRFENTFFTYAICKECLRKMVLKDIVGEVYNGDRL